VSNSWDCSSSSLSNEVDVTLACAAEEGSADARSVGIVSGGGSCVAGTSLPSLSLSLPVPMLGSHCSDEMRDERFRRCTATTKASKQI
jgi:hypothetical protein